MNPPSGGSLPWYKVRVWVLVALALACVVVLVPFAVLEYGNSQWHRYIRLWQRLRHKDDGMPADYTGTWLDWYPDGGRRETQFVKGRRHGSDTFWNRQGEKTTETDYAHGVQHGVDVWWYGNGRPFRMCWYQQGDLQGPDCFWTRNGRLRRLRWYRGGNLHGRERHWGVDGSTLADGVWSDGAPLDGTFINLRQGPPYYVETYRNGVRVGRSEVPREVIESSQGSDGGPAP